ncbi:hypothetical protein [Kitasatospora sp. NE20-6]|uniref:hypothetical protein n=1 Tax=Kitasatospora sp. NE20-6 TaxID=2859066 RepID=UPI0038B22E71
MTAVPEEPSAPVEAAPPAPPSVPPAPSDPPAAPPAGDTPAGDTPAGTGSDATAPAETAPAETAPAGTGDDADAIGSTDSADSTGQAPEDSAQAPAARKPRTARLLIAALLLGTLLGGGTGYAVQAARPATPLPPLGVGPLHYPAEPLDAAAATAAQAKPINIDGDLRKLLVDRPADAKEWDPDRHGGVSGWLTAGERSALFGNSEREFKQLLQNHFRRDAVLAYHRGDVEYRIELMQFGEDDTGAASSLWKIEPQSDTDRSVPIDGTLSGAYMVHTQPDHYSDSTEQYYSAEAGAVRGSVIMMIKIFSPKPVDANEIKDLSKRQWERLK